MNSAQDPALRAPLTIDQLERVHDLCESEGITLRELIARWKNWRAITDKAQAHAANPALATLPKLVRIFQTFAQGNNELTEYHALHGKLFRSADADVGWRGVHFLASGKTLRAEHGEYEVIDPADTNHVRDGDQIRIAATNEVVLLRRTGGDGRWMYHCADDPTVYIGPVQPFTLVASDIPLG